jgi:hypothetical protein
MSKNFKNKKPLNKKKTTQKVALETFGEMFVRYWKLFTGE